MFDTVTGVGLATVFVVPLPSCPKLFRPQHFTELSAKTAQELKPPTAMATALEASTTWVGLV
jgi:hypothetical protein